MSSECKSGDGPLDINEWLVAYFKDRPLITTGYILVVFLFPLAGVVLPSMLGGVTDMLKNPNTLPGMWWAKGRNLGIVLMLILALSITWFYIDSWLAADLMAQLRKRIYCEVMKAYSHNYQSIQVSSVISKAITLPGAALDLVRLWHNKIVPGVMILTAVIAFMVWVDRPAPWSVVGVIAMMAVLGVGFFGGMYTCVYGIIATDYNNDAVQERIGDAFENLLHVYLADAAEVEVERFHRELEAQNQQLQKAKNCSNHFVAILKLAVTVIAFLTFYFLYSRYKQGYIDNPTEPTITTGKMTALVFVFMASTHVIYNTLDAWPTIVYKTAMLSKMQLFFNDLIGHARTVEPSGEAFDPSVPMLVYGPNTSFTYPGRASPALRLGNAAIVLEKDDWVLVTGHIGSGKSTMAMLALGLYGYDGPSSVRIQGREVKTLTRGEIARKITYVQQSPKLLNRTLLENLILGSSLSESDVRDAVERFKRDIDEARSPEDRALDWAWLDLDKVAGKGGSEISGGQRAMVCLMRAMLNNTDIVICDELTANMDPATKRSIIATIRKAAKDRLLLYITHDETISRDLTFTKRIVVEDTVPTVT